MERLERAAHAPVAELESALPLLPPGLREHIATFVRARRSGQIQGAAAAARMAAEWLLKEAAREHSLQVPKPGVLNKLIDVLQKGERRLPEPSLLSFQTLQAHTNFVLHDQDEPADPSILSIIDTHLFLVIEWRQRRHVGVHEESATSSSAVRVKAIVAGVVLLVGIATAVTTFTGEPTSLRVSLPGPANLEGAVVGPSQPEAPADSRPSEKSTLSGVRIVFERVETADVLGGAAGDP